MMCIESNVVWYELQDTSATVGATHLCTESRVILPSRAEVGASAPLLLSSMPVNALKAENLPAPARRSMICSLPGGLACHMGWLLDGAVKGAHIQPSPATNTFQTIPQAYQHL